jgi:hypothetical protein
MVGVRVMPGSAANTYEHSSDTAMQYELVVPVRVFAEKYSCEKEAQMRWALRYVTYAGCFRVGRV